MNIISPNDKTKSIPLKIISPSLDINYGKLGGRPPKGVQPKENNFGLNYFATVKFSQDENLYVSIFVANYETLLDERQNLNNLGFVDIVIHEPEERESNKALNSIIDECDLEMLPIQSDFIIDQGEKINNSSHKIGGYPYIINWENNINENVSSIFQQGYSLVVQFDYPAQAEGNLGKEWVFGDGIFSLFAKPPYHRENWLWYWDF